MIREQKNKDFGASYVWQGMPSSLPCDIALEIRLGFPAGTVAILRKALALKLPRKALWQFSGDSSHEAFGEASRYYKRGNQPSLVFQETQITFQGFSELTKQLCSDSFFVVCDSNVLKYWPSIKPHYILQEPTEERKTLEALADIVAAFKENPKRVLVAIGGGITLDLICFAAKILSKEIHLVPTTFLSMVDASLGGKNGVNFWPYGKNLVGSFYFPQKIIVCSEFLKSLSPRELRSGGAEALKHALLLYDKDLLGDLVDALSSLDKKTLASKIPKLLKLKKRVVERDPFEQSYRMILNLGHTLAHAIEALSNTNGNEPIAHGEAVALGLYYMLFLSEHYNFLTPEDGLFFRKQLEKSSCLISAELFARYTGYNPVEKKTWLALQSYLSQDKKQTSHCDLSHEWVLLPAGGFQYGAESYLTSVPAVVSQSLWYKMWKTIGG